MVRGAGIGSPFLPQATRGSTRRAKPATAAPTEKWHAPRSEAGNRSDGLEHIAAEILVLNDVGENPANEGGVDVEVHARHVRGFEGDLFEKAFDHRGEAAGADVLGRPVDLDGD